MFCVLKKWDNRIIGGGLGSTGSSYFQINRTETGRDRAPVSVTSSTVRAIMPFSLANTESVRARVVLLQMGGGE